MLTIVPLIVVDVILTFTKHVCLLCKQKFSINSLLLNLWNSFPDVPTIMASSGIFIVSFPIGVGVADPGDAAAEFAAPIAAPAPATGTGVACRLSVVGVPETLSFDKHPAVVAIESKNIVIIIFLIVIIPTTCFFIKPYSMPEDALHIILLFAIIIMLRNCLRSEY